MKIINCSILTGYGPDKILLTTDLPPSHPNDDTLFVSFSCAEGTGLMYCEKNFPGVPVDIVARPEVKYSFSRK